MSEEKFKCMEVSKFNYLELEFIKEGIRIMKTLRVKGKTPKEKEEEEVFLEFANNVIKKIAEEQNTFFIKNFRL